MTPPNLLLGLMACLVGAAPANSTTLGVTSDGRSFTIDGKPTSI